MKVLLLNQAFHPDVVSTAQHLTGLAEGLRARGHEVTVLCSNRGYDDPSRRFAGSETWKGIRILRTGGTAYGKKSRGARALDFGTFLFALAAKLLVVPRHDVVVALTSPPLVASLAAAFCRLKGGRLLYWVMDLNPDEAIAAGWLSADSVPGRFLTAVNRSAFRASARVVALDRYMKERIVSRYGVDAAKVDVLPPWAHDEGTSPVEHAANGFRLEHGLDGKFVVMYSGNHSPCHPLDTLLGAAERLKYDPGVVFCFVGGGSLFPKVGEFAAARGLSNIRRFPYQPIERLSESLSAADLHVVVMGDPFVGIVHPCKIYGVLAVGRPFVFVGPEESAIGDLCRETGLGRRAAHGDVDGVVAAVRAARDADAPARERIRAASLAQKDRFSRGALGPALLKLVEMAARV